MKTINKQVQYWYQNLYKKIDISFLSNRVVVDVGCGDGYISYSLSKSTREVHGFDIKKYDWTKYKGKNLHYRVANAEKMPYKTNYFDGLFLKDVLHHVASPGQVMSEIDRVTKKKAHLLFVEANRYNPISYIHMTKINRHEHFTRNQFRALISRYFPQACFDTFEFHCIPSPSLALTIGMETILEIFFEKVPLVNNFQSYNSAYIIK